MENKASFIQQWSGSLLCSAGVYFALQKGNVNCLVNLKGCFEQTRIIEQIQVDILRRLSDSLGIPLFVPYSNANYHESDFKSFLTLVNKKYGEHTLGLCALKEDNIMNELKQKYESNNMKTYNFVENWNAKELYIELMNLGFQAHILSVNEKSLNRSFIGSPLTIEMLDLFEKNNIHPFGANGEFETLCTNAPHFKYNLSLNFGDMHSKQDLWFREVLLPT